MLPRYERIAFEKSLIAPQGQPLAAFVCPGHPLLDATLDLTLDRHRDLLRRGTVLVDERDPGTTPRVLFYLEHAIQDASLLKNGDRRTISKQMLYVEMDATGQARHLHYAPYLDYRPLRADEPSVEVLFARPESAWITRDLEQKALAHADRRSGAGTSAGGARPAHAPGSTRPALRSRIGSQRRSVTGTIGLRT